MLRADIDRLRGRIAYTLGSAPDGHRILMHAARSVAADDPVRALEMAAVATVLAVYGGDSGASIDGSGAVDRAGSHGHAPRPLHQAAAGRHDRRRTGELGGGHGTPA